MAMSFVLLTSCLYQKEEDLKPKVSLNNNNNNNSGNIVVVCDTSAVSYSKNIATILQKNCYACHSDATADANATLSFESYDMVNADMTEIVKRINLPTSSQSFMPKGGSAIDDCSKSQITSWVNKGGLNN
ncbi:MAG: hypothetical protein RL711_1973 [Bacteroidota bacterium]